MEVVLATSLLAGYAVNQILRGGAQTIARGLQIVAAGLTSITIMVGIFIIWRRDQAEGLIRGLPDMSSLTHGFLRQGGAEFYLPIISSICLLLVLVVFVRTKSHDKWYLLLLASLIIDFYLYAAFATINTPGKLELGESASTVGQAMPPELAARQSDRNPIRYHLLINSVENYFDPYGFYGHEMATGYDPTISKRYKTFSGIDEAGRSTIPTLLDAQDRTLDLLNVNYLLIPKRILDASIIPNERVEYGGITFTKDRSLPMELRSGESARFYSDAAPGDTLAIVSKLINSVNIGEGSEVAEIFVGCASGERMITMLRAGRDTAEWAYDRPDVRTQVRHSRAPLAASSPGDASGSFQAHSYLARLSMQPGMANCGRSRFVKITAKAPGNVVINLENIALYDSTSGLSTPLVKTISGSLRDSARWREISVSKPELRAYENLRFLPRVWLVNRVELRPDQEQLQLIRGESDETGEFDPRETALIDPADATKVDRSLLDYANKKYDESGSQSPGDAVNILKREPSRMIIDAAVSRPSMLVMSEISFPGWRARVDEREIDLLRVNYILRGAVLTSGKHVIEIFYRPRSLIIGGVISGSTVLFLFVLFAWKRYKRS
ncbi:MAG: YfhO family protein [Blastocatellia bacterium]|nr:YfhO family protein [Blastocatellia bacterium]